MGSVLGRGGAEVSAASTSASNSGTDERKGKVVPWDGANMKRVLDEALVAYVEEHSSLTEDYRCGDAKLVLMYLAIACGCVAQFAPVPFPANRALLAGCAVAYFALSGVYQYWVWFIERDYIYASRAPAAGGPPLLLRSRLPKFDDMFVVIAESPAGVRVAEARSSVGAFFTKVRRRAARRGESRAAASSSSAVSSSPVTLLPASCPPQKGEFSLLHFEVFLRRGLLPAIAAVERAADKKKA